MKRAYKTEIKPTPIQLAALLRHCGAARWTYNWGLARKIRYYRLFKKTVGAYSLDPHLTKMRARMDGITPPCLTFLLRDYSWIGEISAATRQAAFADLDTAYKNFFERVKKGKKGAAVGFPRFKSRHNGIGGAKFHSFRVTTDGRVKLSNVGPVKLAERDYIPVGQFGKTTNGVRMYGARVTERAGRWYVAIQVDIDVPPGDATGKPVVGVDVGIKSLAAVSDSAGCEYAVENPKALRGGMRKLKRMQRTVSRRVKGSANRKKAVARLAKIHARIANIRTDATHKATTMIARNSSVIGIESLNVTGMMANHKLAGAVADANMGEFLRQLKYKAAWNGVEIVEAGQWEPTSKTCSDCGNVKASLTLADRTYTCDCCGLVLDRDINAARNLAKRAGSYSVTKACGGGSSVTASAVAVPTCEAGIPYLG